MEVDVQSILFQYPCNIFITGPSGCGKTEFVHKLIDYRKDLLNIVPERVVWCYKEWQKSYSLMQSSSFLFLAEPKSPRKNFLKAFIVN